MNLENRVELSVKFDDRSRCTVNTVALIRNAALLFVYLRPCLSAVGALRNAEIACAGRTEVSSGGVASDEVKLSAVCEYRRPPQTVNFPRLLPCLSVVIAAEGRGVIAADVAGGIEGVADFRYARDVCKQLIGRIDVKYRSEGLLDDV